MRSVRIATRPRAARCSCPPPSLRCSCSSCSRSSAARRSRRSAARRTRGAGPPSHSATFSRSRTARASSRIESSVRSRVDLLALLFGGGLLLASTGCGTRYARVPVSDDGSIKVVLRAELRDGQPVDRGFKHPATISGVRIAHVLAQIDVRMDVADGEKSERRGAFPVELVYPLGDQLSAALAKADPSQEVVVQALRTERKLGLFTQSFATSFLAWVGPDELLHLELSLLDWPVP